MSRTAAIIKKMTDCSKNGSLSNEIKIRMSALSANQIDINGMVTASKSMHKIITANQNQ